MIPVLGSISVGADRRVEVQVDSLSGFAGARIDYAVALSPPSADSRLWLSIGTLESPGSLYTAAQVPGSTVWVRVSGRSATGAQLSEYSTAEQVDILDTPDFLATSFTLSERVPTVSWTPGALTVGVRLYWDVHDQGVDPGTLSSSIDLEADAGAVTLSLALTDRQAITLRLESWSAWDSDLAAATGDMGQVVGARLIQAAPAVEAHAHTHEEGGTDELELGNLVIAAPDGGRWRLAISNAGVLGTEAVS